MSTHVLIPGGGHGGWAWHPVGERLHAAGHAALPVTLPGLGPAEDRSGWRLDDAVAHVVAVIEGRDLREVVLVGHSFGGIVISAVAGRLPERVAELVYVSAHVPLPGQSFVDALPPRSAARSRAAIDASPDGSSPVSFEQFRTTLMQDSPEAAARIVHDLLVPTPGRYLLDPYDGPAPGSLGIPARYVLAADDHALVRPGAELAARLGVEPVLVPGDHEALLVHPDAVAAAIQEPRPPTRPLPCAS